MHSNTPKKKEIFDVFFHVPPIIPPHHLQKSKAVFEAILRTEKIKLNSFFFLRVSLKSCFVKASRSRRRDKSSLYLAEEVVNKRLGEWYRYYLHSQLATHQQEGGNPPRSHQNRVVVGFFGEGRGWEKHVKGNETSTVSVHRRRRPREYLLRKFRFRYGAKFPPGEGEKTNFLKEPPRREVKII